MAVPQSDKLKTMLAGLKSGYSEATASRLIKDYDHFYYQDHLSKHFPCNWLQLNKQEKMQWIMEPRQEIRVDPFRIVYYNKPDSQGMDFEVWETVYANNTMPFWYQVSDNSICVTINQEMKFNEKTLQFTYDTGSIEELIQLIKDRQYKVDHNDCELLDHYDPETSKRTKLVNWTVSISTKEKHTEADVEQDLSIFVLKYFEGGSTRTKY